MNTPITVAEITRSMQALVTHQTLHTYFFCDHLYVICDRWVCLIAKDTSDFPETHYSKHSLVLVSTSVESAGLKQSTQQSKTYLCLVYLKEIC